MWAYYHQTARPGGGNRAKLMEGQPGSCWHERRRGETSSPLAQVGRAAGTRQLYSRSHSRCATPQDFGEQPGGAVRVRIRFPPWMPLAGSGRVDPERRSRRPRRQGAKAITSGIRRGALDHCRCR